MADETIRAARGEFDEDGALHLTGFDAMLGRARKDWTGATFKSAPEGMEARRAHTTCPHCATDNLADAETCWNCSAAL